MSVRERAGAARRYAPGLADLSGAARSRLLRDLADALVEPEHRARLLAANAADMEAAELAREAGRLSPALVDRLALTAKKLDGVADGLRQLAELPDLIDAKSTAPQLRRELDEGLVLTRVACPLGLLGVVFEARPDAVPQITGLAIKSGNAVLLKGGHEAALTNAALVEIIHGALARHGVDPAVVGLLADRAEFQALLDLDDLVDLVIARGSNAFVRMVMDKTRIPVMGHAEGLCHVYLHPPVDPSLAARVVRDAKCDYPAACNAVETVLWHADTGDALDACVIALRDAGVELRGCEHTRARHPQLIPANDEDWDTEYTAKVLSIRRVPDVDAALAHIAAHGSKHTEAILTEDQNAAESFLNRVDAASVFHNASTRFADGYRYGLGAEVGISTGKLHARGPVGVEGLLTYRWLLRGRGQIAGDYGPGKKTFRHRDVE